MLLLDSHPTWSPLSSHRVQQRPWGLEPEDLGSSSSSAISWLCDPPEGHSQTALSLQQGPEQPWTLMVRVLGPPGESQGAQSPPHCCPAAWPGGRAGQWTDTALLTPRLPGSRRPQGEQGWPRKLLSVARSHSGFQVPDSQGLGCGPSSRHMPSIIRSERTMPLPRLATDEHLERLWDSARGKESHNVKPGVLFSS